MGSPMRRGFTYGNVVATLALFLALGGGAYAALRVPPGSVGSRQLKAGAVIRGKVANGAISGAKVADGSLGRADLDLAGLGPVPLAHSSDDASEAERVGGHQADCPAGAVLIRGLCFDSQPNSPATDLEAAALSCAGKGGYLPSPMQLYSARGALGVNSSEAQFTDSLFRDRPSSNEYLTIVVKGGGMPEEQLASSPASFYCVYPLLR
jgi:hypothetical protein